MGVINARFVGANHMESSTPEQSQAEGCAIVAMYKFRELIRDFTPTEKLLGAKSLLKSVRQMVEDLEQSV